MTDKLLLVGSIPLDTAEKVMRDFGGPLGRFLPALPDGEVGLRRQWISRVHYQVFALHHDVEVLRRPRSDDGTERLFPHDASDGWQFKVKSGVADVRFGERGWRLGFARDAINSYFIFRTLREKGVIADHLRFQVSLPMAGSVCPPRILPDAGSRATLRAAYLDSLTAEVETICSRIPARDLAIQWDCASEVQEAYGVLEELPAADAVERNLAFARPLSQMVPEDALLGYHLCFGTLGGWPRFAPDDLSGAVKLANGYCAGSGRRVDWMHIPALPSTEESYYAPLAGLAPAGARVYLGLVHNMASFPARLAAARKFAPNFGLAAYCGFGRVPPDEMPGVLDAHLQAAKAA